MPTTSFAKVVGPLASGVPSKKEGMPVVCPSQPYSSTKHMLLSVYGSQWKKRILAMFSLYIDDSGSDPHQPIAIG